VADPPLDQRPSAAVKSLLSTPFALTDFTWVRREVEAVSRRWGITDDEIEDWITAVNELMVNVIRHGGGRGTVHVLLLNDRFTCDVTDRGPGFNIAQYVRRTDRPSLSDTGGMGLWVVGQMAQFLLVDSGPTGTTIRIAARTRGTVG
jgi:serine/threonine-protein kinase RsbW